MENVKIYVSCRSLPSGKAAAAQTAETWSKVAGATSTRDWWSADTDRQMNITYFTQADRDEEIAKAWAESCSQARPEAHYAACAAINKRFAASSTKARAAAWRRCTQGIDAADVFVAVFEADAADAEPYITPMHQLTYAQGKGKRIVIVAPALWDYLHGDGTAAEPEYASNIALFQDEGASNVARTASEALVMVLAAPATA